MVWWSLPSLTNRITKFQIKYHLGLLCELTGAMKSQGMILVPWWKAWWMVINRSSTKDRRHKASTNAKPGGSAGRMHADRWYRAHPTQSDRWNGWPRWILTRRSCGLTLCEWHLISSSGDILSITLHITLLEVGCEPALSVKKLVIWTQKTCGDIDRRAAGHASQHQRSCHTCKQ